MTVMRELDRLVAKYDKKSRNKRVTAMDRTFDAGVSTGLTICKGRIRHVEMRKALDNLERRVKGYRSGKKL